MVHMYRHVAAVRLQRPKKQQTCHVTCTQACKAPGNTQSSPSAPHNIRSQSLVCLHVFQELEAAITGIVMSLDGCEMRVRRSYELTTFHTAFDNKRHNDFFNLFLQVMASSGDAFSMQSNDTAAVASAALPSALLIDFSDLK